MISGHAADNDVSYLVDAQAFYVRHINSEPGSEKLVWDYDNMYWAMNVFLAQVTNDGALQHMSTAQRICLWKRTVAVMLHACTQAGWTVRCTAPMPELIICGPAFLTALI